MDFFDSLNSRKSFFKKGKIGIETWILPSQNWRGKPLSSREALVNLIHHTTTQTGLTITAQLDEQVYEKGRKVTDGELTTVNIERSEFHGEWNYIIRPTQTKEKV